MRRDGKVLRPMTPLYDPRIRRGSVDVGNTPSSPGPTYVFFDDFARPDSQTIADATHPWEEVGNITQMQIVSERVQYTASEDDKYLWVNEDFGTPNLAVEADVFHNSNNGTDAPALGVLSRVQVPWTETFYMGRWYGFTGGWEIHRCVNGVFGAALVTVTESYPGSEYRIRLETETVGGNVELRLYRMVGSTMTLKASFTDSSASRLLTGNYAGFRCRDGTAAMFMDDFAVQTL